MGGGGALIGSVADEAALHAGRMDPGGGPGQEPPRGNAVWQNDPLLRQSSGEFREKFFFQREAVQDVHDSRRCGAEWRKEIALRALYELAEQYVKEKSSWEETGAGAGARDGEASSTGAPGAPLEGSPAAAVQTLEAGGESTAGVLGEGAAAATAPVANGIHANGTGRGGGGSSGRRAPEAQGGSSSGSKSREGRGGRSGPRRGGSGGGGGDRGAAGERGSGRGGANKPVPEGLYKTKMCYHFLGAGCVLGAECNFAHGEHELRGPAFSGCGPTRSPSPLSAGSGPGSPLGGGGGGRSGKARRWSGPGLNGGLAAKETAPAGAGGHSPDGLRTPERAAAPGRRGSGGGTQQLAWAGAAPCQPGHVSPTRTPPSGKGPPISGLKIAVAGGEDDSPDGKMSTPKWARELVGSAELS